MVEDKNVKKWQRKRINLNKSLIVFVKKLLHMADALVLTRKEVYGRKKRSTWWEFSEKKLRKRTIVVYLLQRLEMKHVASTNWTENVVGHILHCWSNKDDPITENMFVIYLIFLQVNFWIKYTF